MHKKSIWILVSTVIFSPALFGAASDPTKPFNTDLEVGYANLFEEEESIKVVLQAITSSRKNKSAIINNILVHEGDEVAGYTVKKIKESSVLLQSNDESLDVSMDMVARIKD